MSDQMQPSTGEEQEVSSSGLLLSVEPLPGTTGHRLSADDTDVAGGDADASDADASDAGDADTTDEGDSDADGTDLSDADGTDTGLDADGMNPLGIAPDNADADNADAR